MRIAGRCALLSLLLAASAVVGAALPLSIEVEAAFQDKSTLAYIIRVSRVPTSTASISVLVRGWEGEVVGRKTEVVAARPGSPLVVAGTMTFPQPLSPGLYSIEVTVEAGELSATSSAEAPLPPEEGDVMTLLERLTEFTISLEKARYLLPQQYEEFSHRAIKLKLQLHQLVTCVKRGNYSCAASLYAQISQELEECWRGLRGEEASLGIVSQALKSFDSYLNLDPGVVYSFWTRVILASFILPAVLLVVFPLYVASTDTWISNLGLVLGARPEDLEKYATRMAGNLRELLREAVGMVRPSFRSYLLLVTASFMATVALLANNVVALIGSMIVSPVLLIVVGSAIGLAFREEQTGVVDGYTIFWSGLKRLLWMMFLSVSVAYLTTLLVARFYPVVVNPAIEARARPNISDLGIAVGAGVAGALASIGGRRDLSTLVGAAIAIALIPPAATIGIGLALAEVGITFGALSLLTLNVIALEASSVLVARIYVLAPLMADFLKSAFRRLRDDVLRGDYSDVVGYLLGLLALWVNLILDIRPSTMGLGSAKAYLRGILHMTLYYALLPLAILASFTMLLSSNATLALAAVVGGAAELVRAAALSLNGLSEAALDIALLLSLLAWLYAASKRMEEGASARGLTALATSAAVLWLSFTARYSAYCYPRAYLALTLVFAGINLLIALWRRVSRYKGRIAAACFVVVALMYTVFQSAYVYQTIVYRLRLSKCEEVACHLVANFLGLETGRVVCSSEMVGDRPVVRVGVMVSPGELYATPISKEDLKLLSGAVKKVSGWSNLELEIYYIVTP